MKFEVARKEEQADSFIFSTRNLRTTRRTRKSEPRFNAFRKRNEGRTFSAKIELTSIGIESEFR